MRLILFWVLALSMTLGGEVKKIAVVGGMWPLPSIIILLDKSASRLVYIPIAGKNAIKESVLAEFYPEILQVAAGSSENIEEILNLHPDLVFCHASNVKLCKLVQSSKIPTIPLSVNIGNYNYRLALDDWLEKVGKALGKEEEAKKLIKHNKETELEIDEALKKVHSFPRAMIIHQYNSDNAIIADGLFANYLLEHSGAKNVFSKISANKKINLEEIYSLDPEIIFITNFTPAMPEDLLNSKLWQAISAVKNKRVYKIPLGSYRWFAPAGEFAVFLKWLAKKNHPEVFGNIDIKKELRTHFQEFYQLDLSAKQIEKILHPSPKAGILK